MANFGNILENTIPGMLEQFRVPGAIFSVISNFQLQKILPFGYANKEEKTPMTEDSIFCLCSISKSITAWGVMRLVEEGKLDLDKPVENYLTRWHIPPSKYDVNQVTLRRLLSHTAGMSIHGSPGWDPHYPPLQIERYLSGDHDYQLDEKQKHYEATYPSENESNRVEIIEEPGKRYMYSGGGYTIIQLVVEEVTGMSFSEYIEKAVLIPLGMNDSYFDFTRESKLPHSARYDWEGEPYPFYRQTNYAAGGVMANIKDLTKFALATLNKSILQKSSFDQMYTPLVMGEKALIFDSYYGLGHCLIEFGGVKVVFHSGGHPGVRTFYICIPQLGEGFCLLFNSNNANPMQDQVLGMWGNALGFIK